MARPTNSERFKKIVDEAAAAPDEKTRQAVISRAAKRRFVTPKGKRATSKPSPYTERLGIEICERIAQGEVLPEIVKTLGVSINTVYSWVQTDVNGFRERYRTARLQMCESLVDNLLLEARTIDKDTALAAKVKASIVTWYAGKTNPGLFGDTRKIELSGEVHHKHAHQLADAQKKRIAEAWLLSQQQTPAITAETTGPDIPVQTVKEESRELPKRKSPAIKQKAADDDDGF